MGYYVYKYVENKEPVYVGKTTDLDRRIKAHTKDKLANFHGEIYYFDCPNETAMNSWEYCLINKYHPKYNVALKRADTIINSASSLVCQVPAFRLYIGAPGTCYF